MNARRTAVTQPRDLKLWLRATLPKGVLRPSDARQSHHFEKSRPTLVPTYYKCQNSRYENTCYVAPKNSVRQKIRSRFVFGEYLTETEHLDIYIFHY